MLFSGDPVRFPECLDVAVVLPELRRLRRRFGLGVVAADEDEEAIGLRRQRWPSLVFLRDGPLPSRWPAMRDWDDLRESRAAMRALTRTRHRHSAPGPRGGRPSPLVAIDLPLKEPA